MKATKFLVSILALLFLCNCSNSDIKEQIVPEYSKRVNSDIEIARFSLETPDSTAYPYTIEEDKILMAELGFDTTYVQVFENSYKIDDSNGVEKEALRIYRERPNARISVGRHLNVESQQIFLNTYWGGLNSADIILEAIDEWNNIENCNIHFFSSAGGSAGNSTECNVDFKVTPEQYGEAANSLVYTVHLDFSGLPNMVTINTLHPHWALISDTQKKYLIMHALGHVIALNDITNEWDYMWDPTIMKSHTLISESNTEVWSGFSENDIAQLQQLYPIPTTEFSYEWSGSDSNSALICAVNSTISVTVEQTGGNSTDYTLEYTVDADESDYTVSEWGSSLNFQFLEAGTYTVTITPVAGEETFAGETFEIEVYDLPEMSYSWSPALQSENKVQIDEPYNLEIDGVGSQYDFTIEVEAETAGNECSCTEVNARAYQLVFDDPGVYNITLTVKIGTKTLITETLEIVAVDEPTFDFSWSPIPKNTKNKLLKGETYSLAISGLGNQYTVGLEVTPDTVEMEYDLTATSNRNFELVFNDTGKYNLAINVYNGERFATSKTIEVTAIEQPSINPTWTAASEIGTYYALSTDYTLNLNYVNDYYDNSNGFTYTFAVYLNDADTTSTVLKSKNGQQAVFNFNLPGEYRIVATVKRGSTVLETYETTCPVVGGKIVRGNSPDEPTLNSAYTFTYHYWHPEHEEVSYEFKMSEELFDAGSSRNIYYQMESANSFMISFRDYGCYYIEATVKDGYEVCDKKIINFTKLYHPETCTFNALAVLPNMGYGEIRNYVKFNVQLGSGSTLPERFFGYIQRYKEIRRAFYITGERRVDREFTYTLLTIQREKESNALCNLPDGGFGISLNPSDPYEIYEGYTGYIHYPMDGVRLVPSKEIEILPKQQIRYDLNNLTEINF